MSTQKPGSNPEIVTRCSRCGSDKDTNGDGDCLDCFRLGVDQAQEMKAARLELAIETGDDKAKMEILATCSAAIVEQVGTPKPRPVLGAQIEKFIERAEMPGSGRENEGRA